MSETGRVLRRLAFALGIAVSFGMLSARGLADDSLDGAAVAASPVTPGAARGVAGGSLTSAVVLDRFAVADLARYRRSPSDDVRSRGEATALISGISFVVAGLAAATALAILLVECPTSVRPRRESRHAPSGVAVAF